MPVVLKKITRQYEVVCDACEALIGFVADEVRQRDLCYYDDSELVNFVECPNCKNNIRLVDNELVNFVECPNCKNNIRLMDNYKKKLKSTEV